MGGNRSQLARGGRKLGAAKVVIGQPFLMVIAGDCGDGDGKGEQNIAVANHEERKLGRRKICLLPAQHSTHLSLVVLIVQYHLKRRVLGSGQEQWFPTSSPTPSTTTSGR